jgi:CheY-like chemotaxis protein
MQKILIVEDDADLVETYTDLLETNQYSVTSTAKAKEAITLVTRLKPNLVLLDLNLAGFSGVVVINMIRSYPPLKDTKIVVITGHPEMLYKTVDASRVDLILSKPVSNDQLLKAIRDFAPSAQS